MELVGRRFGHIRVTDVIGQGGMGDVYGAFDETLERKVALKVLNADQRLDAEARERLLREARALSKLEHPNICRIHDYIESDEVDLLVLEFIDGQTLFETQTKGMARSERLRIAVAIAEVLITAHRSGILHRDLKPENVMLTKTGEVKVLDFGLARWLHRGRTSSSGRHAVARLQLVQASSINSAADTVLQEVEEELAVSSAREPIHTAIGITLGTPLYMSPEQARGQTLTSASDMFSFGLLLQWLFTGKDPHPIDVTAREAILRVARGETLPVEGAAGDITALINRLKQFAPADRPTAVEALERLRHLANKPQRIARRGIAAAVALVLVMGTWRYAVDLRRERAIAVAARSDADRRRAQAEGLIEFMLGDLRKKLEPVGRLDILDDAAQRSVGYFTSLDITTLPAADLVRNAKALHQLGDARMAQGKPEDAMTAFRRALLLAETAMQREPNNAEAQLAVGTSEFWIGSAYRTNGDLPHALEHWTAYMNVGEKLAARYPRNDDYQLERAYGHGNVATLLEAQGDLAGALAHNRVTMRIKKARLDASPADTQRQEEYARTVNKVGFVLQQLGDLSGALDHFRREFAILASLASRDPENATFKQNLATSRSYIGGVEESLGNDDGAIEQRVTEMATEEALHAADPANVNWQRNLAVTQMRVADLLRRRGESRRAAELLDRAEGLMRDLAVRPNARPAWKRDRAVISIAIARVRLASRDAAGALRAADDAVRMLDAPPQNDVKWSRFLAEANLVKGEALAATGRQGEAHAAWSRALSVIQPIAGTTDPAILDVRARAMLLNGRNAVPLLQQLEGIGYRHRDLMDLVTKRRSAAEGE